MNANYSQCRYLCKDGERCTAEVVDADDKVIQLCIKHLGRAIELVRDRRRTAVRAR